MNIRDLKYLVALSDHQHFGKAAESCFVSQPALSIQIQKLEEILGLKLLERTNKSILFTEHGHAIVERARKILSHVDEVHEFAKQAKDLYSGELRLGIFPTLAPYLLPKIIPEFTKKFPKISFYLVEEQTNQLLDKLKNGKIDAAFLALPITDKNIKSHFIFEEEFLLAVSKQHPLSKAKKISSNDLLKHKLLLLEEGHCLREQALTFCQQIKAHENTDFRATSLETLRHMVAADVGITLMPKLACDKNKDITYIHFDNPKPYRSIGLVWRETSPKEKIFLDIIKLLQQKIIV